MKKAKDLTPIAKELVNFGIMLDSKNKMITKKEIKKFGTSAHVIVPREFSDGKHEAIVLIKEKDEGGK